MRCRSIMTPSRTFVIRFVCWPPNWIFPFNQGRDFIAAKAFLYFPAFKVALFILRLENFLLDGLLETQSGSHHIQRACSTCSDCTQPQRWVNPTTRPLNLRPQDPSRLCHRTSVQECIPVTRSIAGSQRPSHTVSATVCGHRRKAAMHLDFAPSEVMPSHLEGHRCAVAATAAAAAAPPSAAPGGA